MPHVLLASTKRVATPESRKWRWHKLYPPSVCKYKAVDKIRNSLVFRVARTVGEDSVSHGAAGKDTPCAARVSALSMLEPINERP